MFVTYVIVKRFQANEPPLTQEQIVSQYKLPIRLLNTILTDLTESQIIASTESRKGVKAYLPAIDINQLTLKTMEMKLDMKGSELLLAKNDRNTGKIRPDSRGNSAKRFIENEWFYNRFFLNNVTCYTPFLNQTTYFNTVFTR